MWPALQESALWIGLIAINLAISCCLCHVTREVQDVSWCWTSFCWQARLNASLFGVHKIQSHDS